MCHCHILVSRVEFNKKVKNDVPKWNSHPLIRWWCIHIICMSYSIYQFCSDPGQYLLISYWLWLFGQTIRKGNFVFIHITNSIYTRKYNAKLQPTMIGYLCSVGGLATLAGPLSSAILKFLPVWRQGGCIGVASHRILAAASPSGLDWSWLQPGQPRAWVATRCHQPLWKHKT